MTIENVNQLLEDFGRSIAVPKLSLNQDHTCILCIDKAQDIQLTYSEPNDSIDFFTVVGTLSDQNEDNWTYLLKSNAEWSLTEGMTLAKKPHQNTIVLGYRLPLFQVTKKVFEKAFEHFMKQMERWKVYLKELEQGILPEDLVKICTPYTYNK